MSEVTRSPVVESEEGGFGSAWTVGRARVVMMERNSHRARPTYIVKVEIGENGCDGYNAIGGLTKRKADDMVRGACLALVALALGEEKPGDLPT